jgi:hypothetical protein
MTDFTVTKHGHSRFWAVHDPAGELVCICVYKRGAVEVARRLSLAPSSDACYLRETPPENSREPVLERPDATWARE